MRVVRPPDLGGIANVAPRWPCGAETQRMVALKQIGQRLRMLG